MTERLASLPTGWKVSTLADVVTPIKDKVDPLAVPETPYVGLEHIESHTMRLLGHGKSTEVRSTKTRFSSGDVLYGKLRPYLNKVTLPDSENTRMSVEQTPSKSGSVTLFR